MTTLRNIRLSAAIVLVCAMCLPLGQCSRRQDAQLLPVAKSMSHRLFPQNDDQFSYKYAVSTLAPSKWAKEPGTAIFTLLAFTWPIVFVVVGRRFPESRLSWIVRWIEFLLCVATLCWLIGNTFFDNWLYGAYVVVTAIVIFGCTTLFLHSTAKKWVLDRIEGKKKFYKTEEHTFAGRNRIWVIIARCIGYAVAMILTLAFCCLVIFLSLSAMASDHPAAMVTGALLLVVWTGVFVTFCRRLYFNRSVIDRVEGTTTFYKTVELTVTGKRRIWATIILFISYAGAMILTMWVIFPMIKEFPD